MIGTVRGYSPLLLLVTLFGLQPVSASDCRPGVAQAVSIEGNVEVRRANEVRWESVEIDDTLCGKDSVRVGRRSRAAIALLQTETLLRLDENTTITFPQAEPDRTGILDLLRGAIHMISRTPGLLGVGTPFKNAFIRGTELTIRVESDRSFLWVFEGEVLASNELGEQSVTAGNAVVAREGEAPQLSLVVSLEDAVQWALYYPAIIDIRPIQGDGGAADEIDAALSQYQQGDLPAAFDILDSVPESVRDRRYFDVRAGLLLSVGRVVEAQANIDRSFAINPDDAEAVALQSVIAVAQNAADEALRLAKRAVDLDAQSPVTHMALSFAHQAMFDIELAFESAQSAVNLAPDNALAWARLSELWLSLGSLDRALEAAEQAVSLNPNLSRTQTVLGFAFLTQIEIEQAHLSFQRAIYLDQADPLPRLGLGLAKIRSGDLVGGRGEIEIAAILDPRNALIRSYLGKAYFEEKRIKLAEEQYDIAKELDPDDPTAWLYSAILKQTENRPAEALADIQKSVELNDNRAVYRSQLLLDSDSAARSTSLGRIYDDLGFDQIALIEGTRSLTTDPANHSAHRFLADTYAELPRHEIARVSELLQSQLLQPVNGNPIQPRLTITDLNITSGGGPAEASFNEFTPLLERDRPQFVASGVVGDDNTWSDEIVASGIKDNASFSLGQLHYETDGFRDNADLEHDLYDAFGQIAINPRLGLQAEFRKRDTDQGNLGLSIPPNDRNDRKAIDQETARLGLHASPSPFSDVILSIIHSDREEKQVIPIVPGLTFDISDEEQGYQAEAQFLWRSERLNLTTGVGSYDIDVDTAIVNREANFLSPNSFTREHDNAYLYTNLHYPRNLTWTVGLAYDAYDGSDVLGLDKFGPKAGLRWDVSENTTIRIAALRTLKRALVANQTIEPTQIAGFNQFFDDFNGTQAERLGFGLDARLSEAFYSGLEVSQRDLTVPIENPFTEGRSAFFEEQEEQLYSAYLYWSLSSDWSARMTYYFDKFKRRADRVPKRVETMSLPFQIAYFDRAGLFAELTTTYVDQRIDLLTETRGDDFFLFDLALGYRFPKRRGVVSLTIRNLFDRSFVFQDESFRTATGDDFNPGSSSIAGSLLPDRQILAHVTLNF